MDTDSNTPGWFIAGDGAIGMALGCLLQQQGASVRLISRIAKPTSAMMSCRFTGGETVEWTCPVMSEPDGTSIDRLIVATKAYAVSDVMDRWGSSLAPGARVFFLQNGLNLDSDRQPPPSTQPLIVVNSGFAAFRDEPNHVVQTAGEAVWVGDGSARSEASDPNVRNDIACLDAAGFHVRWTPDIIARRWLKIAVNSVINPLTVIHDCVNGMLLEQPEAVRMIRDLCDESGRILAAMEVSFSAEEIHSETLRVIEATAPNRSSMLQDHRRGDGRHELDYINLPLIRMGTAHGIEVEEHQLVYDRARRMLATCEPAGGQSPA